MLIDCCNFVSAAVLAFGLIVEELAIVRHILYSAVRGLLDALIVDHPCDVWRWFADNLNIEVECFVFAHGYITQIASIDLRWDWIKRDNYNE